WGATAGDDRKMNNEALEREPIDRARARLEALLKANAAPRCGARSKRTGKPCRGAAMPNGRCKCCGRGSGLVGTLDPLQTYRTRWGSMYREREANHAQFSIVNIVANAGMRDHILALVSQNGPSIAPHAHAQVPSHRSPSVKRLRIHFKGMVGSPGWLDGFPE